MDTLKLRVTDGLSIYVMREYLHEDIDFPFTIQGIGRVSPRVIDVEGPDDNENWRIAVEATVDGREKVLEINYNSLTRQGEATIHGISWSMQRQHGR